MKTRIAQLLGIDHPIIQGGMIWGGQVVGLIDDIPTCADLIGRMARSCREHLARDLAACS